MFKFLRTVAEALGRAGLKVMTNGVRADWLSVCGRGFKASWRERLAQKNERKMNSNVKANKQKPETRKRKKPVK